MIAIKPCTFEFTAYSGTVPSGFVGPYEGPLPGPENKSDYVALCDHPYIRLKTEAEMIATKWAINAKARELRNARHVLDVPMPSNPTSAEIQARIDALNVLTGA